MRFEELTRAIESSQTISIYRHSHPDCDALGSQFAMKTWIMNRYPDKHVYALGFQTSSQAEFPGSDQVSDNELRGSLAIILDTANTDRIDDERWQLAGQLVKIDHHPDLNPYGSIQIVRPDYAAACEILTEYFRSVDPDSVSLLTAEYLYMGLLTDTLCFRTNNTTQHTLEMASWLAGKGIDIPFINRCLFDQSYNEFKFDTFLREKAQIMDQKLVYAVVSREEEILWNIKPSDVRNHIDTFGHVKEFQIWAIFTERLEEPGVYDGSLRSKEAAVNEIAARFEGGGHRNAAGVKNLTDESMHELIDQLYQCVNR